MVIVVDPLNAVAPLPQVARTVQSLPFCASERIVAMPDRPVPLATGESCTPLTKTEDCAVPVVGWMHVGRMIVTCWPGLAEPGWMLTVGPLWPLPLSPCGAFSPFRTFCTPFCTLL